MSALAAAFRLNGPATRRLRRTTLAAAAAWLGAHLAGAVLARDHVSDPRAYAAGLVLWLLASVLALRPLVWPAVRLDETGEAVLVATLLPVAALLDLLSIDFEASSSANWVNLGCLVVLAGLVVRRHGRLAVAAGALVLVVESVVDLRTGGRFVLADLSVLWAPIPIFLLGGLAVREHLDRAAALAAELRTRSAAAETDDVLRRRWAQLRARSYADLDDEVMPLLEQVLALPADEERLPRGLRESAEAAAAHLRDVLLARSLMSPTLRRRVQRARARGVRVVLHNRLDDGAAVHDLRELVGRVLDVPGLELLSVRTFVEPSRATLVVRGDWGAEDARSGVGAVERAVALGGGWWQDAEVHDLDGDVLIELARPRVE